MQLRTAVVVPCQSLERNISLRQHAEPYQDPPQKNGLAHSRAYGCSTPAGLPTVLQPIDRI